MLSMEQRQYSDSYQYRGGMLNIAYVSGFARMVSEHGGYIQQTRNVNHWIPFTLDRKDSMPGFVSEMGIIKVIGRVYGVKLPSGHRICVLKALRIERPSILEMPAERAWELSPPPGAPVSDFEPKFGQHGLPLTFRSNDVRVAGFVSGVMLEKAGTPKDTGQVRSNDRLLILLQQTKNGDEAIPIRKYGRYTEANERLIRLGTPLFVNESEIRIDVKSTGEKEEDGVIEKVTKHPFVQTRGQFKIATRAEIQHQPDWAVKLAMEGRRKPGKEADSSQAGAGATPQVAIATPPAPVKATVEGLEDAGAMSGQDFADLLQQVKPQTGDGA